MTIKLTEEEVYAIITSFAELAMLETFARCNCSSELSKDLIFMHINRIGEIIYRQIKEQINDN